MLPVPFCPSHILRETLGAALHKHPATGVQAAWAFRSPNYPPWCEEVSGEQRLVKTGGSLIRHARYYWLILAESHLTRRLFGSMVRRIGALPAPTG